MSYEKSEPGRVAPVIPGRHGPALRRKRDIYYLTLNSGEPEASAACVEKGVVLSVLVDKYRAAVNCRPQIMVCRPDYLAI